MAAQRKSVYEQLLDPQSNNSPIFDNRSLNLYKDESIIHFGNVSHQNVMDYQSNYDKPIKIKFRSIVYFIVFYFLLQNYNLNRIGDYKKSLLQQYEMNKQRAANGYFNRY